MAAYLTGLGVWLQATDSLSAGNTRLLMIFIGIVALAALSQAIILMFIAIGAVKTQKRVREILDEVHLKAMPAIDTIHTFVRETSPKVKVITENLAETSHIVRSKAQEFDVTISEVNQRASRQAARVDGMVSSALDATASISETVHKTIRTPVIEIAGVVNGLKAGLDVLVGRVKGFGSSNASRASKASSARKPMDGGTDLVR